jgi:hypothetical protein
MLGRLVCYCLTALALLAGPRAFAQSPPLPAPLPRLLAPPLQAPECTACNGSALLCDKHYNEVAYPTTHNAMSCREEHWLLPNQNYGIAHQLTDGVRAMMLDVHYFLGKTYLAHGSALFGRKLLVDGLGEVRQFMDSHPCEVITLIFESRVRAADVAAAFQAAGLMPYLFTHALGQPYPTLKEMVQSNQRLVVFTDREGGAYPWYHAMWDYCVETPWKAKRPSGLTNRSQRGDQRNELCIVNHFLTAPTASPRLAAQVNFNPFFQQRVENFVRQTRRMPNFVVVDYYDIGALFEVVDTLNGLPWPQRRHGQLRPTVQPTMFEENGNSLKAEEALSPDLLQNRPQ